MANVNDLIRKAARGAFKRRTRALESKGLSVSDAELYAALRHLALNGNCPVPAHGAYGLVTVTNAHFEAMGMPMAYEVVGKKDGEDD